MALLHMIKSFGGDQSLICLIARVGYGHAEFLVGECGVLSIAEYEWSKEQGGRQ